MPVQVDTPSGIGAVDQWDLWGSATDKVSAVKTNDGDTSVLAASSGGRLVDQLFTFPQLLGIASPVTAASLTSIVRVYSIPDGGGGVSYYHYWNSTLIVSNRHSEVRAVKPNYATIVSNLAGADLNSTPVNGEHGMRFTAAGGPEAKSEYWVTQIYRTVTFTYTAGSMGDYAHLIGSLVGSLIGAGLLLRDMPALNSRMGSIRLRSDELEPAWRDWTEWKRPAYGI